MISHMPIYKTTTYIILIHNWLITLIFFCYFVHCSFFGINNSTESACTPIILPSKFPMLVFKGLAPLLPDPDHLHQLRTEIGTSNHPSVCLFYSHQTTSLKLAETWISLNLSHPCVVSMLTRFSLRYWTFPPLLPSNPPSSCRLLPSMAALVSLQKPC